MHNKFQEDIFINFNPWSFLVTIFREDLTLALNLAHFRYFCTTCIYVYSKGNRSYCFNYKFDANCTHSWWEVFHLKKCYYLGASSLVLFFVLICCFFHFKQVVVKIRLQVYCSTSYASRSKAKIPTVQTKQKVSRIFFKGQLISKCFFGVYNFFQKKKKTSQADVSYQ